MEPSAQLLICRDGVQKHERFFYNWSIRSRMQILWFPFKLDFSKIPNRNLTVGTSGKYLVVLAGADSRKSWDLISGCTSVACLWFVGKKRVHGV
jgi:hypothetical protein